MDELDEIIEVGRIEVAGTLWGVVMEDTGEDPHIFILVEETGEELYVSDEYDVLDEEIIEVAQGYLCCGYECIEYKEVE